MSFFYNLYLNPFYLGLLLPLLLIFDLVLKGIALWFAARNKQKVWFVSLLIVNSLGILPLIYLMIYHHKLKKIKPRQSNSEKKSASSTVRIESASSKDDKDYKKNKLKSKKKSPKSSKKEVS